LIKVCHNNNLIFFSANPEGGSQRESVDLPLLPHINMLVNVVSYLENIDIKNMHFFSKNLKIYGIWILDG